MAAPRALVKRSNTIVVALDALLASEAQLDADLTKTRQMIGVALRDLREDRDLTMEETRALSGLTETMVSLLERGLRWNRAAALRLAATFASLPRTAQSGGRRE